MRRGYALALLGPACAACTQVTIYSTDGSAVTERHFFTLGVSSSSSASTTLVDSTGLGLSALRNEFVFGFWDQQTAILSDDCQLIIWAGGNGLSEELITLLANTKDACIIPDDPMEK